MNLTSLVVLSDHDHGVAWASQPTTSMPSPFIQKRYQRMKFFSLIRPKLELQVTDD